MTRDLNPEPLRRVIARPRKHTARDGEHAEQVALMRWAAFARARFPELVLLYAVPNGGHRHKATAARLKAEGVRRGVPDVCLPVARSGAHGLYIELKSEHGKVTSEQRGWIRALRRQGYVAEVCHGWESARSMIEHYLAEGPRRGPEPTSQIEPAHGGSHEQAI